VKLARLGSTRARALVCFAVVAGLLASVAPGSARILKTRRPGQLAGPLELTVGSGFEYETDGEESEYGFPFLAEYGFTSLLKLSVEPSYVFVRKKLGGSISGFGDLETTLTCEFPTERRYRPGLALEGTLKWPTARRGDLGTGERDYSIGAIVSKEFVRFDLDFNAVYTFIGDPPGVSLQDVFEASLASEWHLSPSLELLTEVVTSSGAGRRGRPGSLGGFANIGGPEQGESESEVLLGLAEPINEFLKFEQGAILKSDGSFQFVLAWEWDFGGGQ
jgi:hypothetical protein